MQIIVSIVGVFRHGDTIKGFLEPLLGVLVLRHIERGQVGFTVFLGNDVVYKFDVRQALWSPISRSFQSGPSSFI